jgi:hypothetical protein
MTAPTDYLSGDWTKFFGPERILMDARGQATRQRPWELMPWWNSRPAKCPESLPWNQSPVTHLCQEAAEILSLGGAR